MNEPRTELQIDVLPPQPTLAEMDVEQRVAVLEFVIAGVETHYQKTFSAAHIQTWTHDLTEAGLTEAQIMGAVMALQRTRIPAGSPFPVPQDLIELARPSYREPSRCVPLTEEEKAASGLVIEKFHARKARNHQP